MSLLRPPPLVPTFRRVSLIAYPVQAFVALVIAFKKPVVGDGIAPQKLPQRGDLAAAAAVALAAAAAASSPSRIRNGTANDNFYKYWVQVALVAGRRKEGRQLGWL